VERGDRDVIKLLSWNLPGIEENPRECRARKSVTAEIRTEHLPITTPTVDCRTSLLDVVWVNKKLQ
jgi:hypothetical protein